MPKTSKIVREQKLIRKIRTSKRVALRAIIKSPNSSVDEVVEAVARLDALPVNQSEIRHMRRCSQCGRQRAVYRRFKLCRLCIREYVGQGYLPGVVKSSW